MILKLGGSVITKKEKVFTPNFEVIKRLAREVSKANVSPLIIIHGAGSYGHPLAERYNLIEGFKHSSQLIGFAKTHEAMVSLNRLLVDALIDQGVPVFSAPPSTFTLMKDSQIEVLEIRPLVKAIEIGLTPVLYGDVALDSEMGFTIISGDKIAASLAVNLGAEMIVMGVDVDGLCTGDPKIDPSARLIKHLTLNGLKDLQDKIGGAKVSDVTGGMLGKVSELMVPVACGIEARIVNALKPNNVYKALIGEEFVGTRITKS